MRLLLAALALLTAPGAASTQSLVSSLIPPVSASDVTQAVGAIIQRKALVTNSDGSFSGTWDTPFTSAPVASWAIVPFADGQTAPYDCAVRATATGFDGRCWQLVATTLPSAATAMIGLTVSPFSQASGNINVRVGARQ